jgi:hypothetical protein
MWIRWTGRSHAKAQKVYDRVMSQTKPGSIILCHDIHETTIAAMPAVLDDLKGRGYAFATVTQLISLTTPPPEPPVVAAGADASATPPAPPQAPSAVSAPLTSPVDSPPSPSQETEKEKTSP